MDEKASYDRAKRRVRELKDFYQHVVVYLLVNAFLFVINMLFSRDHFWFYWPLFGWGIALIIHGISVLGSGRFWGSEWEERKIREIMEKEKNVHPD